MNRSLIARALALAIVLVLVSSTAASAAIPKPTALTATAVSSSAITLHWTDTSTTETSFEIQRSLFAKKAFKTIATAAANATTFLNGSLAAATTYYFRVKAVKAGAGSSPWSNVASATTTGSGTDTTAPSVPAGLTGTATCNTMSLAWNAATDTGGSGLAKYNVYRNNVFVTSVAAPATTASDNVNASTTYTYTVSAVDGASNESAKSAPFTVTTPACGAFSLVATAVSCSQINLHWSLVNGATTYKVYVNSAQNWTINWGGTDSYLHHDLRASATYSYWVTALDAGGTQLGKTNTVSATTPACPASPPTSDVCSADGFCWSQPSPQGNTLTGIWGAATSDIWAVGYTGTILHFDGSTWRGAPSGTEAPLWGVWGADASHVWAVGNNVILSWNGSVWSKTISGLLRGIWGSNASDVWAVGNSGFITHWNGAAWTSVASGTTASLFGVWGTSANNVWAAGANGTLLHYNGTAWSTVTTGTTATLNAVGGTSATDVWVVGASGTILHSNGSSWSTIAADPASTLTTVWPASPTNVLFGGTANHYRWNGSRLLADATVSTGINGYWGTSATNLWGVGSYGLLARDNGTDWTFWSKMEPIALSMWGASPTDVWVFGFHTLPIHWNGSNWTGAGAPIESPSGDYYGATGFGSNDVWAVGGVYEREVIHWNGSSWSTDTIPASTSVLRGVWGATNADMWAVGDGGTMLRRTGGTWNNVTSNTTQNLNGVAGAGGTIFAVGNAGTILRWSGTAWSAVTSPTTANLRGIWAVTASDMWAVGNAGTIIHWNGSSWNPVASNTTAPLNAVRAISSTDVWAVGDFGVVLAWNGAAWSVKKSGHTLPINALWADASNDIWLTGWMNIMRRTS